MFSGQTQMAMSPMYGMSQPQSGFIPGGSYDPFQGMGGYGGGFGGFPGMGGGYSMFGSYNAMPDYTGGYLPGYGSQLPSQFGGGASQFGGMSQFGGGYGGGFGGYGMQPMQPNVNDLFGQYMFGQYYGAPSFNPFQATSMFGAGGGARGFGGGQRRGSREQFGGFDQLQQLFGQQQAPQQPASPFEGLELDIDALRAALGLSGQAPASPTAQITPNEDMTRGLPQTPAATPTSGVSVAAPQAPIAPPVQIPPNLNLFVPGFAGLDQGGGRQVQAPVETVGFAPPPTPIQQAPTAATASPMAPSSGLSMADLFGSRPPTQQALEAERKNQALLDQQKNQASQRLGANIPTGPQRYTTERVPTPSPQAPQFAAPQASLPETGGEGRFYTEPTTFSMTVQPTPIAQMPEIGGMSYYNPPVTQTFQAPAPVPMDQAPMTMPQFSSAAVNNLELARQAALANRRGGGR